MIRHNKVPGYESNLWQEHIAHFVNDEFIGILDASCAKVRPNDYLSMMFDLQEEMNCNMDRYSPMMKPYMQLLMTSMSAWNKALRQARC